MRTCQVIPLVLNSYCVCCRVKHQLDAYEPLGPSLDREFLPSPAEQSYSQRFPALRVFCMNVLERQTDSGFTKYHNRRWLDLKQPRPKASWELKYWCTWHTGYVYHVWPPCSGPRVYCLCWPKVHSSFSSTRNAGHNTRLFAKKHLKTTGLWPTNFYDCYTISETY